MDAISEYYDAGGGRRLACRGLMPSPARARVVLLHGWGDHGGRYLPLARHLHAQGIASWMPDMVGHGLSPGPRAQVHRFQALVEDLDRLLAQLPPGPRPFLCGQSMGGCLAAHYALQHPERIAGVVFLSAALGVNPAVSRGRRMLAAALGRVAPRLPVGRLKQPEMMSSLPEEQARYAADRLVHHGSIDAGTGLSLLRAAAEVRRQADGFAVPFLALQGTEDCLVDPGAAEALGRRATCRDVRVDYIPGGRHELFIDRARDEVSGRMAEWIGARVALGDSAAG